MSRSKKIKTQSRLFKSFFLSIFIFLILLISACGNYDSKESVQENNEELSSSLSSGVELELELKDPPSVSEEAELEIIFSTVSDLKNIIINISLPDGIDIIESDVSWKGNVTVPEEEKKKHPKPPLDCEGEICEELWKKYEFPKGRVKLVSKILPKFFGNFTIEGNVYHYDESEEVTYLIGKKYLYLSVEQSGSKIINKPFLELEEECEDMIINGEIIKCALKESPKRENERAKKRIRIK